MNDRETTEKSQDKPTNFRISARDTLINAKLDEARMTVVDADLERQFLQHMFSETASTKIILDETRQERGYDSIVNIQEHVFGEMCDEDLKLALLAEVEIKHDYALKRLMFFQNLRDARKTLRKLHSRENAAIPETIQVSYDNAVSPDYAP